MSGLNKLPCVKCGQAIESPKIWNGIWLRLVCEGCFGLERKRTQARWYQKRKRQKGYVGKRRAWEAAWTAKNRERVRQAQRNWYAKNKASITAKARDRYKQDGSYRERMLANSKAQSGAKKKQRDQLADQYVRHLLSQGSTINPTEWPSEAVELKRKQIEALRLINENNEPNPGNAV